MSSVTGVNTDVIISLINDITVKKTEAEAKIQKAKSDFDDNKLFDASAEGSAIGTTDLTMEKVGEMTFEEINELLETPTDAAINSALEAEEEKLNEYITSLNTVSGEIEKLQDDIKSLEAEIERLRNDAKEAERKINLYNARKAVAEDEVTEAQSEYNRAIRQRETALSEAEEKAYDDAMEEYAQKCADAEVAKINESGKDDNDEDESSNIRKEFSFNDILREKRNAAGISSSYESAIEEAASNLATKKAAVKKYDKLITVQTGILEEKNSAISSKQSQITSKNNEISNKQTTLQTISNNINTVQTNVSNLENQMAVRNFINENQEAIEDIAYKKDPDVIACKSDINNANGTITAQLAIAQQAKTDAEAAAKNGDKAKAQEEKEKADAAKVAAEEAKAKADAAKTRLIEKYGSVRTAQDVAGVATMADKVQNIQSIVTGINTNVATAEAIANAQGVITASAATITTELTNVNNAVQAARTALAEGDETTAETKLQEAREAQTRALAAQQAAKEAEEKLKQNQATEQKTTEMASINTNISNIANLIANAAQAKSQAAANKEAANARKAKGVTFATTVDEVTGETTTDVNRLDLTSMLSAEELKIVTDNNIDLTAFDEKSGYPIYILAKAQDGKFHIYKREFDSKGNPKDQLKSLARLYGSSNSAFRSLGLAGTDIISVGSGYMNGTREVEEGTAGAKEVYYLTCVSDDFKSCAFGNAFKSYTTGSPLSLDLNGDGVRTSDSIISYDIDGDGILDQINDSADAVLVFDNDNNGIAGEDGAECFGNNTDLDGDGIADGYKDGFEALKALALREGLINNQDDMQLDENDIRHLEENFGFKIKANGYNSEAQSLSNFGITAINLARTNDTTMINDFDGRGNQLMTQEGATFVQNGEEKEYADIWHRYLKEDKKPFLGLTLSA